jgi:phosphatidylglycerophosphatase A
MSNRYTLDAGQRRALMSHPAGWIASGFGAGLVPKAQGTFGSAVALLPWLALRQLPMIAYVWGLLLALVVGIWACSVAGRRLRVSDHRALVWDEFLGQWIAWLPVLAAPAWQVALGFGLFRLFDIWKPWPVCWLDRRVKGGAGVMLDDVGAGLIAALVLVMARAAFGL